MLFLGRRNYWWGRNRVHCKFYYDIVSIRLLIWSHPMCWIAWQSSLHVYRGCLQSKVCMVSCTWSPYACVCDDLFRHVYTWSCGKLAAGQCWPWGIVVDHYNGLLQQCHAPPFRLLLSIVNCWKMHDIVWLQLDSGGSLSQHILWHTLIGTVL